MSARSTSRASLSIGEVLTQLRADFPDVTISKIRFLESEGLVEPDRTSAGYRKFSHADVQRLRYVLTAQRDHYLPLRVIKDHLDALDRGLEPADHPSAGPRVPDDPGATDGLPGPGSLRQGRRPRSGCRAGNCWRLPNSTRRRCEQLEQYGLVSTRSGQQPLRRHVAVDRAHCRRDVPVRHRAASPARHSRRPPTVRLVSSSRS